MRHEALDVLNGFLQAEYGIDARTTTVHIGEVLAEAKDHSWITAWNPLGLPCGEADNARTQAALLDQIDAAGCAHVPGFARSPTAASEPAWYEPCAVLQNAPVPLLDALARQYRQLAVVVALAGAPARLRCYRDCWIERFGVADMDAPNVEWVA